MKTGFEEAAAVFQSATQTARVDTEAWASLHMFCPSCGCPRLSQFSANRPVADFFCQNCGDQYELKSQKKPFGRKVLDGAYDTKIKRLESNTSPNLILLQYDQTERCVRNLKVVPSFFFVPITIEKRKPLAPGAKRAGWVGSNIILDRIPASGQITVIQDGLIRDRSRVIDEWNRLRFVERRMGDARGWLLEVMQCVDRIGKSHFSLSDVYAFEGHLAEIFPLNRNVRPKIRQQLQVLRDGGYIEFVGRGQYRMNGSF